MKKKTSMILSVISCMPYLILLSNNSPLYKLNEWCDPNIYLTVAKGMRNHMVLYRDIFDHKGPMIYFLGVIADMVSPKGYIGLWIQEIVACTVFMYFALKLITLFKSDISRTGVLLSITLTTILMFGTPAFMTGYSAEEICLPLLMISSYITLKTLKNSSQFSIKDTFVLGLCAGFILWTKFTILGIFIGILISIIVSFIKNRSKAYVFKTLLAGLSGIFIATLIPVAYFASHNALPWLYEGYIKANLSSYSENRTGTITEMIITYAILLISSLLVIRFIDKNSKEEPILKISATLISLSIIIPAGLTAVKPVAFIYYYEVIVTVIPILISVTTVSEKFKNNFVKPAIIVLCAGLMASIMNNIKYIQKTTSDEIPQIRFSNTMHHLSENPTLLMQGSSDIGFFRMADIIPTTRETSSIGIINEDIAMEHISYIEDSATEFLITDFDTTEARINGKPINYYLIDYCSYSYQGVPMKYYLYRRFDD